MSRRKKNGRSESCNSGQLRASRATSRRREQPGTVIVPGIRRWRDAYRSGKESAHVGSERTTCLALLSPSYGKVKPAHQFELLGTQ